MKKFFLFALLITASPKIPVEPVPYYDPFEWGFWNVTIKNDIEFPTKIDYSLVLTRP